MLNLRRILPTGVIRVAGFDKAIVLALGLKNDADGLLSIHMLDGTPYTVGDDFAYETLAKVLQDNPSHDRAKRMLALLPNTPR